MQAFNRKDRVVEGWYWAFQSKDVKKGHIKPLSFMGRELAVYRGQDGRAVALDAFCPHMGAHLAEGKVIGNDIRCFFHQWKYNRDGELIDIPVQTQRPCVKPIRKWHIEERYQLLWIWAGESEPTYPLPFVPELEDGEYDCALGNVFQKGCHPNIVMINAIDEQHFKTVHHVPWDLKIEPEIISTACIAFKNQSRFPEEGWVGRLLNRVYKKSFTSEMVYFFGTSGSVTVGPDFLHFYIIFTSRPSKDGKTEGQTILLTKKRKGPLGWIFSRVLLFLSQQTSNYFAVGDSRVFETIRFSLDHPVKADTPIIRFIQHLEQQKTLPWGLSA